MTLHKPLNDASKEKRLLALKQQISTQSIIKRKENDVNNHVHTFYLWREARYLHRRKRIGRHHAYDGPHHRRNWNTDGDRRPDRSP